MNPYREWRARFVQWIDEWGVWKAAIALIALTFCAMWTRAIARSEPPAIPTGECRETLSVLRAGDRQDVVCPHGANMQSEKAPGEILVRCTCGARR